MECATCNIVRQQSNLHNKILSRANSFFHRIKLNSIVTT